MALSMCSLKDTLAFLGLKGIISKNGKTSNELHFFVDIIFIHTFLQLCHLFSKISKNFLVFDTVTDVCQSIFVLVLF